MEKAIIFQNRKMDSGKTWLLFLLLGWYYGSVGSMGKQILYWITFAGFGVWWVYLLFTLGDKIKVQNRQIALEIGMTSDEMMKMGIY